MLKSIPCTLCRGGTSKGLVFLAEHLPPRGKDLDHLLLAAMGSPSKRQIDGVGGAETLTSKVVIISLSQRTDTDIDYLFAQVTPGSSIVDYESNCGNMLSTIASFVIDKGLFSAQGYTTDVRIYNINTDSTIIATVCTPGGVIAYEGDARIDGVEGTAAPVILNFSGSVGSRTSGMLPTGFRSELIDGVRVSIVDVAVPTMIVTAQDLGKTGYETKAELDADVALIARLEAMRCEVGRRVGLGDVSDVVIPKPLMISRSHNGASINSRDFTPLNCHATHSVTGALALATACLIPGTVAHDLATIEGKDREEINIENPGGVIGITVMLDQSKEEPVLLEASLLRTCRKLMDGCVYIPSSAMPQ